MFGIPSAMALRRIQFARRRKRRESAKNQLQRFRVSRKEWSEWNCASGHHLCLAAAAEGL